MSSVGFWTRARANRGHRVRSSILRVLEKGYLSMRKRLGGRSTLEQGSTRLLGYLGNSIALEHLGGSSMVVLLLEHAREQH